MRWRPEDYPVSHWGKVIYAVDGQVNHTQEECTLPIEESDPLGAHRRAWCMPTNLAHTLLLRGFLMCRAFASAWRPKGDWLDH